MVPVTVLLCDDHPVVRLGLRALLDSQHDIVVVGEAADGAAALVAISRLNPQVVLMDLRMPGMDGATAHITAHHPEVKVLVVTTYETDTDILRAVEAGAAGYLLKDTPGDQLADAVRAAARGETVLAPIIAARLMSKLRGPAHEMLTVRETEVLAAVSRGASNGEAGRELFISEATVKTHLLRVFAKLGVNDRTAAVTVAIERGMLPSPSQG